MLKKQEEIKISICQEVHKQSGGEIRKAFGQAGVFFRKMGYFYEGMKRFHPFLEVAYRMLVKEGLPKEKEMEYVLRLTDYGAKHAIMREKGKHRVCLEDILAGIIEIMKTNRRLSEEAEMVFAEFIYAVSGYRNDYAVDAFELARNRCAFDKLVDAVCSRLEDNGNAGGEIYSRKKRGLLCGLLAGKNGFSLSEKQQILVANAIARENVMKRYDAMDVLERCNGNLCEEAREILQKTASAPY